MSKNKLCYFLVILSAVLFILPGASIADDTAQLPQGQANHNVKFGFRITGGAFPLMRNDINDHLLSYNDIYNDSSLYTVESEFELIKMGMEFGGEILVSFMPNFSIGIGAGYLSAGKETTMELIDTSFSVDHTYHPQFSVIPITFSLYYGIPVGSSMQVVFNAGLGYYLGTVNIDYSWVYISSYHEEGSEIWSAKSNALGFHGGIDLEFNIAPNIALVVGAKGRFAKLTDLTGDMDYDYSDSYGNSYSTTYEDQTLWRYILNNEYELVAFYENKPTGSAFYDVRKAEVNLSGIVFQAGIKITF